MAKDTHDYPESQPLTPAFRQLLESMSSMDQNYYVDPSPDLRMPTNVRVFAMHCTFADLGKMVHRPMLLVVNFVTEGGVIVDGQIIRLKPGHALLIWPNQFHDYSVTGEDTQALWLFINFECPQDDELASLRNQPVVVSPRCLGFIEALAGMYATGGGMRHVPSFMNQISLLVALILENLQESLQVGSTPQPSVVFQKGPIQPFHILQKASEFIVEHIDGQLQIKDVAKALGISPGYLRNIFHAKLGMGLGGYMKYVRLQRAIMLMDTTDKSLTEIAFESGYGSLSAFSRAFSRNKGIPPGEFRLRYSIRSTKADPKAPQPIPESPLSKLRSK